MRRTLLALLRGTMPIALALALPGTVARAAPTELRALLERQAPIEVVAPGAQRLVLPAEVQAQTRADRADLRILDGAGRSVPFELFAPARSPAFTTVTVPRLADVQRSFDDERRPLGERLIYELEDGPVRFDAIDVPLGDGGPLVARVDVSIESGDGRWRRTVADAPLFRVSGWGRPTTSGTLIEVPRGTARRVRLDVRIQQGAWVAPTELTLLTRRERSVPTDRWPLTPLDSGRSSAGTRLRFDVPAGLDVRALEFSTTTEGFVRPVRLLDAAGGEIARDLLARMPDGDDGLRERLRIDVDRLPAGELTVEIEDAGEPPLEGLAVEVETAAATLVFLPSGSGAPTLYWKGRRLNRTAHGRGSILPELMGGPATSASARDEAVVAWMEALPPARLGPTGPNPRFEPEPQLFADVRPGATLDPSAWTRQALVEISPSRAGIAAWLLSLEMEALLRPDHRDLRIVDDTDRQLPYVLEAAEDHRVPVELRPVEHEPGVTQLEVGLPATPIAVSAVELEVADRFFDRVMHLRGRVEGSETEVSLARREVERRREPATVRLPLSGRPGYRIEALTLEIVDGDDAPLEISRAWITARATRVIVAGPAGTHRVLLGAKDAEPPRYELRSASELLAALPAGEARPAPVGPNPSHRAPGWLDGVDAGTTAVWIVIALAVVALVTLSLRLAGAPDAEPPASDGSG